VLKQGFRDSTHKVSLRTELGYRLKATNMELENQFAAIRAAVPFSKHVVNAERLSYLGNLESLMSFHTKSGRNDTRGLETRDELLKKGVPLEQRPPKLYRNDDASRRMFARHISNGHTLRQKSEEADPDEGIDPKDVESYLGYAGDIDTPVRPEVLGQMVYQSSSIRAGGVQSKVNKIRQERSPSLLAMDAHGIPDDRRLEVRLSCVEMHPGLCAHRDQDYMEIYQLAKSFENCLGDHLLHRFVMFRNTNSNEHQYHYFARRRPRATNMQTTHSLISCKSHANGSIELAVRSSKIWELVTLWTIARNLLRSGWREISILNTTWRNNDDGTVTPSIDASSPVWDVWPRLYKRPPKPRDDGPPGDDVKPRKPSSRTAGVRILGPVPIGHLPPVVEDHRGDGDDDGGGDDGDDRSDDDSGGADVPEAPNMIPPPGPAPASPPPLPPPAHPPPMRFEGDDMLLIAFVEPAVYKPIRAKPGQFSFSWGPFSIAQIRLQGVKIGWGITCGKHVDVGSDSTTSCKTSLTFGKDALSDDDCILRLKRWCLTEPPPRADGLMRKSHINDIKARSLSEGASEKELDDLAKAMV
jgi:hypothetical protein